jgi:ATP-dependent Clp protease ATP-binding subunit ClpA
MFERFTDAARRVVVLAQEEARSLDHDYIGTEHLWLGLLHEGVGVAAQVAESLGVSLEDARQRVEEMVGRGGGPATAEVPFTPEAKRVLERAWYQARDLGHSLIDTEEILLALLECGGVGREIMEASGVTDETVVPIVNRLLHTQTKPQSIRSSIRSIIRPEPHQTETGSIPEPTCAVCRVALSETAATFLMDVPGPTEEDPPTVVSVLFCSACGSTVGLIS